MGTVKIGKLDDWGDGDLSGGEFVKLKEGSNIGRIFTKPYQFYVVWTEDAAGKQRTFRSAVKNCPLVQRGEKPKPRWYVGWLNRETNKPQILEIGQQIYKGILTLHKKKVWGDPRGYDIDIERQAPGSQPLYIVSPLPKESITDDEKGIIKEFMGRTDFEKLTEAPTPEEVMEQLGIRPDSSDGREVSDDFDNFENTSKGSEDEGDDFNFDDV